MGVPVFIRRLFRRRVQLTLFGGLATVFWLATTFLATQVFMKLDDYNASSQDNIPWSMSRLEVEQLKLIDALRNLEPNDPENMHLVHRRFNAIYSRRGVISVGEAYFPLMSQPRAQEALDQLSASIDKMEVIIDSSDAAIIVEKSELLRLSEELTTPIRQLASMGINAAARFEVQERQALTSKLVQLAVLSLLLLTAMFSLGILLWSLYRLYRERALENRQTLNRLTTILDTSQDAVLVVCPSGGIIDNNRAANTMFFDNKPPADNVDISSFLLRKQPDGSMSGVSGKKLLASCKNGPNLCANLIGQSPSGDIFPVELSADTAIRGGKQVVVCFIRNIARRVADQNELLAARDRALSGEKAKARFLGMISHEMRTPLTGMLGALDLLDDTAMTAKQKTYAHIMQSSGQILLNQINDALDVAQADQGTLAVSHSAFDLDVMIDTLLDAQRPLAHKSGISLRRANDDVVLGTVHGDRSRVHQILLNLVSNAIKFTREGEITVEATRLSLPDDPDDMIEFRVADTGIGIPDEDQARIFEDFVRLENAEAQNIEGTGLGLGIVRNLVVLMGGEISVDSNQKTGSVFSVRLPLPVAQGELTRATALPSPIKSGPQDVLIVEDNEINRAVLAELLEKDGHHVWTAENGADGVKQAAARCFDVILMDINMPVMGGIAAAQEIRSGKGASVKSRIVALSAHVTPEVQVSISEAQINASVTKPLRREDLGHVLLGVAPATSIPAIPFAVPVMDNTVLAQLRASLSTETWERLLTGFIVQGSQLLDELDELKGDILPARLHDMAGLSATLGARALHARLSQAELALRAGDAKGASAALEVLPDLWGATVAQLDARRAVA